MSQKISPAPFGYPFFFLHEQGKMADANDNEDSENEYFELHEEDEEDLIRYYFFTGFDYKEIVSFLLQNHGIQMSMATFKRRLRKYGLRQQLPEYDIDEARTAIQSLLNGPGCLQGYRSVLHTLQLRGVRIPRIVVQQLLKQLDPEGTEMQKAHRLKRRRYHNTGPNYSWHCDG